MNPTKFAIAAIITNPQNQEEVLAVKRPPTDDSLPNIWRLPAIIVNDGELPEDAIKRLGVEKLSTEIKAVSYLGVKYAERSTYRLILMDLQANLTGNEPSVREATTTGTKYIDQQWTSDYSLFKEAASKGSLCSQIFLDSKGISW